MLASVYSCWVCVHMKSMPATLDGLTNIICVVHYIGKRLRQSSECVRVGVVRKQTPQSGGDRRRPPHSICGIHFVCIKLCMTTTKRCARRSARHMHPLPILACDTKRRRSGACYATFFRHVYYTLFNYIHRIFALHRRAHTHRRLADTLNFQS